MYLVPSGSVTVQLGGKDRGAGPAGGLELVRNGVESSPASSLHGDSGFQGPWGSIEWLPSPNARCMADLSDASSVPTRDRIGCGQQGCG
jgi:hypothetical protein